MLLRTLAGVLALLAPAAAAPARAATSATSATSAVDQSGLYVATKLNYHPLPRIERVPSEDGWEHWFKLEEANITLRPDRRFIASFRYYRQHVRPRAAVRPGPLLNETYKGKYSVSGTKITFTPDKTKEKRAPKQIIGTLANAQLMIPYIVAEGQSKHPLRLDLRREGNW
jgi:hypothetical protein